MDPIRITGDTAKAIAADVRRLNPGSTWTEVRLVDESGCKLHARRDSSSRTEYVIVHRTAYGCRHGDVTQDVTVVPADRTDVEPRSARLILTIAEKRLRGMVERGVAHQVVAGRFAAYERAYRAACKPDTTTAEWDELLEAVAS